MRVPLTFAMWMHHLGHVRPLRDSIHLPFSRQFGMPKLAVLTCFLVYPTSPTPLLVPINSSCQRGKLGS